MQAKHLALSVRNNIVNHSPAILTGLAAVGVIGTAILSGAASIKVDEVLRLKSKTQLTKKEKIKIAWKYYIPTAIVGGATIACIIGSNTINRNRNLALAGAYSLASEALKEYRNKVVETIGANKERKIQDEIVQDKVLANPITEDTDIIYTGKGETLCYEPLCGTYFRSSAESIRQDINNLNYSFLRDSFGAFLSLNDVYYELGLPATKLGEEMGWHIDDGMLQPTYTSVLDSKTRPCLCINFPVSPRHFPYD